MYNLSMAESGKPMEGVLLEKLATAAIETAEGVLARVWMIRPGDVCPTCPMAAECGDRSRCLHLVSSSGTTRSLDGPWRRFPVGAREVGLVARTLRPHVAHRGLDSGALADPLWIRARRVASFAAVPVTHAGECLGVLAVFGRRELDPRDVGSLERLARFAGAALAHAPQDGAPHAPPSPGGPSRPEAGTEWLRPLRDLEREIIEQVLRHTGGRVSGPRGAARILDIKPTTLDSRIRKLGVRKPARRRREPTPEPPRRPTPPA